MEHSNEYYDKKYRKERITVGLNPSQIDKLNRLIKEYGIRNKSDAVRLALEYYFGITIDKEDDK